MRSRFPRASSAPTESSTIRSSGSPPSRRPRNSWKGSLRPLRAVAPPDVISAERTAMLAAVARQPSDLQRLQARTGYLFVFPAFALYAIFVLAPVIVTCILSFTYFDPMVGSRWVGLDNYVRFFSDDRSQQIFWNTLRFTVFAVTG